MSQPESSLLAEEPLAAFDPTANSSNNSSTSCSIYSDKPAMEDGKAPRATCIHSPIEPSEYGNFEVSIFTNIGGRKYQEDRVTLCTSLIPGRTDFAFFGVFDGTVGEFAADNVKDLVVPHLTSSPAWLRIEDLVAQNQVASPDGEAEMSKLLQSSIQYMYEHADKQLIEMCSVHGKDYSSSTSVTAVLAGNFLAVGHLGDSRIAIGYENNGSISADFLTVDHKPDTPSETQRIKSCGGSVEYLQNHNNKPFIRGGDFTERKGRGQQPMQLQYSRAFGGKDLKMFGLSSQPDIKILRLEACMKCIVLATDGLWDIQPADKAVHIALDAKWRGINPAKSLVETTLTEVERRGQCADNITAMAVFFKV